MIVAKHGKSDNVLESVVECLVADTPPVHALIVKRGNVPDDDGLAVSFLNAEQLLLEPGYLVAGVVARLDNFKVPIVAGHRVDGEDSRVDIVLAVVEGQVP